MLRLTRSTLAMPSATLRALVPWRQSLLRPVSTTTPSWSSESFLSGANSVYAEEMYRAWRADPSSVHASWAAFFSNVDAGAPPGEAFAAAPAAGSGASFVPPSPGSGGAAASAATSTAQRVMVMVRAFQVRGHERAKVDPLGMWEPTKFGAMDTAPEVDVSTYGFTEAELDSKVQIPDMLKGTIQGFMSSEDLTIRQLAQRLQDVYCGSIGYEYMHIQNREQCNWIRERIETVADKPFTKVEKTHALDRITWAETLETFFASKYSTAKRFGIEGVDSLIVGTKTLLDTVSAQGVENVVFGMPHRGRLNVLANVLRKPLELIFKEFDETHFDLDDYERKVAAGDWSSSGDVKYHLGTSHTRTYEDGRKLNLSLVANPSHLEAVNPIVVGKVRAKQDTIMGSTIGEVSPFTDNKSQWGRKKPGEVPQHTKSCLGVLMHGDAAFAGQGVVYETMMLSALADYQTGGTIHVVANNQVGFTTNPSSARSTLYSTDLGKAFDVPIFHVNADDIEAVVRVFKLAAEYRQKWATDVIIDLIGYRRWGHNEGDQPLFTQPLMYKEIHSRETALSKYKKQLLAEGSLTQAEIDAVQDRVTGLLEEAYLNSKTTELKDEWRASSSKNWEDLASPVQYSAPETTGVDADTLRSLGASLTSIPADHKIHRGLARIFDARRKTIEEGAGIDWATAESLAFASLLSEGHRVRLSGQDVERGTFSHRHVILHDQETGARYCPFDHLDPSFAPFTVANSPLSEFAVLGFETGYSLEDPKFLNLWEAQFGDFVNGAQVIIDQFISAGEAKWQRPCGVTLLLPHGFDGQGPEHSSCRLERFLQATDDHEDRIPETTVSGDAYDHPKMHIQEANWQVVNCTTPANYFHVLRRQQHRNFRKPLIIASPKALLRLKAAASSMDDMAAGTRFKRVIYDDKADASAVTKVVFCSGKVYYDLDKARSEGDVDHVAIVRVEQLAPFPHDRVAQAMAKYPNLESVVWAQEEPRNMGAWSYVAPRLTTAGRMAEMEVSPEYVGREAAASPAAGMKKIHDFEQAKLVGEAME